MKILGHEFHVTMPLIVIGTLVLMFFVVVAYAHAADFNCNSIATVTDMLDKKYGESLQAKGSTKLGITVNVWTNPKTHTWTFALTTLDTMCIVYSGWNYTVVIQGKDI